MPDKDYKLFSVYQYTLENLLLVLENGHLSRNDLIDEKHRHFHFFWEYFNTRSGGHNAKTIVVEEKYMSKSYLQDYSNFYSTCYVDYERFCKRVHFFEGELQKDKEEQHFQKLIEDPAENNNPFWASYLGYIVIRPLSKAIIGATLVRPFSTHGTGRHYTAIREYKINLFGKEISMNSLVYQEQDGVVGACASSALWSAFHKTSMHDVFHTPLLSPSEITKSTKAYRPSDTGRVFPNSSVSLGQVLGAINEIGLEAELVTDDFSIKQLDIFKAIVYAYLRMGLPVLLTMQFEDDEDHHIVTINGYRVDTDPTFEKKTPDLNLQASQISKFYAHDDQVGPFARFGFREYTHDNQPRFLLETPWIEYEESDEEDEWVKLQVLIEKIKDPATKFNTRTAHPYAVIVPLSNEIRIPFMAVYENLLEVSFVFDRFLKPSGVIVWDIYLDWSNNYKSEVFNNAAIDQWWRNKILFRSLPKYVWMAKARVNNELYFEIIFDATNVAESNFWKYINIYNTGLRQQLTDALDNLELDIRQEIKKILGNKYLELIEKELQRDAP